MFPIPSKSVTAHSVFELIGKGFEKVATVNPRPDSFSSLMVTEAVNQDRPQPAAKRPDLTVVVELWELDRDDPENFLNQIVGIVSGNRTPPQPAEEVWGVQRYQPPPGIPVGEVACLLQESGRSLHAGGAPAENRPDLHVRGQTRGQIDGLAETRLNR
jgi:hypothetical protein